MIRVKFTANPNCVNPICISALDLKYIPVELLLDFSAERIDVEVVQAGVVRVVLVVPALASYAVVMLKSI